MQNSYINLEMFYMNALEWWEKYEKWTYNIIELCSWRKLIWHEEHFFRPIGSEHDPKSIISIPPVSSRESDVNVGVKNLNLSGVKNYFFSIIIIFYFSKNIHNYKYKNIFKKLSTDPVPVQRRRQTLVRVKH